MALSYALSPGGLVPTIYMASRDSQAQGGYGGFSFSSPYNITTVS